MLQKLILYPAFILVPLLSATASFGLTITPENISQFSYLGGRLRLACFGAPAKIVSIKGGELSSGAKAKVLAPRKMLKKLRKERAALKRKRSLADGRQKKRIAALLTRNAALSNEIKRALSICSSSSNHQPQAEDQTVWIVTNTSKTIIVKGNDGDGDALTYRITSGPLHGTLSGTPPQLTYSPALNFEGSDSFQFTVNDGQVESQPGIVSLTVNSWQPPLGVPPPAFGISETHYMYELQSGEDCSSTPLKCFDFGAGLEPYRNYGSGPCTHYVDSSSSCSDQNNPYGAPANPRCSIPQDLAQGSVVEIHGSAAANRGDRSVAAANASAAKPVFVRGYSGTDKPVLTGYNIMPQGYYIIFENLILRRGSFDIRPYLDNYTRAVHHIAVRSSETDGESVEGRGCVSATGTQYAAANDIVVYNNHVHHAGDSEAAFEDDTHGVAIGSNVFNVWVLDNYIHHTGGDSVQMGHGANFTTHHIYIARNHMHDDRENAVDIKEAADVIVSQNEMHDYFPPPANDTGHGPVVVHYEPPRVWIMFNTIYNSDRAGIVSSGALGLYIIGNVVYGIHEAAGEAHGENSAYRSGAGIMVYNTSPLHIVNNTISDVNVGIGLPVGSATTEISILSNIISDVVPLSQYRGLGGRHLILNGNSTALAAGRTDGNLFYQPAAPAALFWGQGPFDVAGFKSAKGKCLNCMEGDPAFLEAGAKNFRLAAGSPAVDKGIASEVYDIFSQLYGFSIMGDADGTARPRGAGIDIGAYEQ